MDGIFEGQCFCGSVRFRQHGRPMFIHCCHCKDCQRQTGSAFALNAIIEADRVEVIKGKPVAAEMATDSGHPHDIYRCPDCGSALWSDYGRRGWMLFVRVAALDDPSSFVPDVHIFTRSKLPWVVIPDGAKSFEEYYDMKALWPPESWARRDAARASAEAAR
jgi:hypothetical protein